MSDALSRLVQRVVAPETVLQPRVPFLFEDPHSGAPAATFESGSSAAVLQTHESHTHDSSTFHTIETTTRETTSRELSSSSSSTEHHHHHHVTETEPRFLHLAPKAAPPLLPPNLIAAARAVPSTPRAVAARARRAAQPRALVIDRHIERTAEQEPHVEITIGRIDVRAVTAPQSSSQSRERAPRRDLLTLEEYIQKRSGR